MDDDESSLTLTYFMAMSNLIPNAFIWKNLEIVFNCLSLNHNTSEKSLTLLDNGIISEPNVKLTCDLLSNATYMDCHIPT